jgi:hypothetical protein
MLIAAACILVFLALLLTTILSSQAADSAKDERRSITYADLPDVRRQQLLKGALDAFDHEGSPMVRALAARLLSLVALVDRGRALPALADRSAALRQLLDDASADYAAAELASTAYTTASFLAPDRIMWVEPLPARSWEVLNAARQVHQHGINEFKATDAARLRTAARAALDNDDPHNRVSRHRPDSLISWVRRWS